MERKWWTLVVVCAATFMLLLDITIVIVALPQIQAHLHAGFSAVQWTIDAYALTLASLLLTSGSLADLYGRKLLFLIGLVIFTLGSLLCGVAQSAEMLIISRGLQGVGGAILFATSLALLSNNFAGRERGIAFGIWGAVIGVSTSLGPILGGVITSGISWRGIFLVNVPVGAAAVAVAASKVAESRLPHAHRPDWAGFAVLTAGLVSLVYGLIRASETAWSDTGVVVCLCLAAALIGTFVAVERRVEHPMFDLSLLRTPTFLGGSVAAFTMNGSLYAVFVYVVLYLQNDLGYSALQSGLRLLLISGGSLIASTVAGRLSDSVPARWLIGPGLALTGVGLLLMSGLDGSSSWTHLIPGFIVAGFGSGMVNPPLASTAVGVVRPERAGMASGVNTTFRQVGLAVSIAALGSIFTASVKRGIDHSVASIPSVAGRGSEIAAAVRKGDPSATLASLPPGARQPVGQAIGSSFAGALNDLFIVTGVLALAGAVCAVALIRSKDFVGFGSPQPAAADQAATSTAA